MSQDNRPRDGVKAHQPVEAIKLTPSSGATGGLSASANAAKNNTGGQAASGTRV